MPRSFVKDSADYIDYRIDWSAWLADDETIDDSTWGLATPPVTLTNPLVIRDESFDGTTTTVWLDNGDNLVLYTVTNRISTSQGRTVERSIDVFVEER